MEPIAKKPLAGTLSASEVLCVLYTLKTLASVECPNASLARSVLQFRSSPPSFEALNVSLVASTVRLAR